MPRTHRSSGWWLLTSWVEWKTGRSGSLTKRPTSREGSWRRVSGSEAELVVRQEIVLRTSRHESYFTNSPKEVLSERHGTNPWLRVQSTSSAPDATAGTTPPAGFSRRQLVPLRTPPSPSSAPPP